MRCLYGPIILVLTHCVLEDELQNVEMAEHERTKKRNELKIKKRDYTGYDDEEFSNDQIGMRRQILAKYDEELEGPKETVNTHVLLKLFRLRFSSRAFDWAPVRQRPHRK